MSHAVTPCHYLFGENAETLFPAQRKQNDPAFVNQALHTVMQIVDHLVASQPDALFLFDPAAHNNQCHLYALMVVQSLHHIKIHKAATAVLQSVTGEAFPAFILEGYLVDRRFFYLSFLLSKAFRPQGLDALCTTALKGMNLPALQGKRKKFREFLMDQRNVNTRTDAARLQLNRLFQRHLCQEFASSREDVYPELDAIAHSDLQIGRSDGHGSIYTYPKFAGVVYMVALLAKERIPLVFKVTVITQEGRGRFHYAATASSTPTIVFEMILAGKGLSVLKCREQAATCPTHSMRNVESHRRHKESDHCLFCQPRQIDVTPYKERCRALFAQSYEMILALGVDFVLHHQPSFLRFFTDKAHYPQLTALFERTLPLIESFSLSRTKELNMSVSHVYVDSGPRASAEALIIEAPYSSHLRTRKLV